MTHPIVLTLICDGNRPDFVLPGLTPNMAGLAARGTWFRNQRGIFPSATRASSASIATGSWPQAHGLRGNAVAALGADGFGLHDSGKPEFLDWFRQSRGRMLDRPYLASFAATQRGALIVSNVSPGAAFFHDGGRHARMIHRHESYRPGGAPDTALAAGPGIEGDRAATEAFIADLLASRPSTATLWLSEPDVTQHAAPLGSDRHLSILAEVDALIGRVIEAADQLHDEGHDVLILLGSDHGHEAVIERIAVEHRMVEAGLKRSQDSTEVMVVPQGSSAFVYSSDAGRKAEIRAWLADQPWAGRMVDGADLAKLGQIPDPAIIALDMAKVAGSNRHGVPGLTYACSRHEPEDGSWQDRGMHGGTGPFETNPVLIAVGRGFDAGHVTTRPSRIIDLMPTALAHLGILGVQTDGQALQRGQS